ncbi:MAG: hypothetical protein COU06_00715, partial [Candidatus Harrisonbacteria bacterium CG10_big_fil_rev_8_21_14_0_10_38_8]
ARAALEAQAQMEYSVEVVSDTNLGQTVSSVRQKLRNDLRAVMETVKTAREAVRSAASSLRDVLVANASVEAEVEIN